MTTAGPARWTTRPGKLDRRILDQSEHWVTATGSATTLTEMASAHLQAVRAMLTDRALELHLYAMVDVLLSPPLVRGELLARGLGELSICELSPERWLESTPLMRAIDAELRRRGA